MTVLLHLSDTHFGTEQRPVVEALMRLAQAERPDLVVMSGDVTQRARRSQFAAARAFVDRFVDTPFLVVPGNHDIPLFNLFARIVNPYGNHRRVFGHDLEPVFESTEVLVIGVNTTRNYRHKDGELSLDQVERVARLIERAAPLQLRVIVTHQPVAAALPTDTKNLLHGRQHALRRWAEAGANLILGGHIHLPYVLPLRALAASQTRPMWAVQAGTALSSRVRGATPNSVNLIRYAPSRSGEPVAHVERWDYQAAGAAFEMIMRHELRDGGVEVAAQVTSLDEAD